MDEDIENAPPPIATDAPSGGAAIAPSRASRAGAFAVLAGLLALLVAALALWRVYTIEHGQAAAQATLRDEFGTRVDALARGAEQNKRDLDSLRTRLADADGVNKSLREELLGLGERSRHLEDAVANLAEQRLTGRDALALSEAEFVLQQAQERLTLFHDAQAAIAAYRLADSALAAAEDPVFASVRQTIDAERRALEASAPVDTQGALAVLERVRESLATLPAPQAATAQETSSDSRWARFLAQFVHISHRSDIDPLSGRDVGLKRSLSAIDVRAAEAALLARDPAAWKDALVRTRADIAGGFDAQSAPVKDALAALDRLAAAPFAPALPVLGSALKELRNLRATRALAQPPLAKPAAAATPVAPATEDRR